MQGFRGVEVYELLYKQNAKSVWHSEVWTPQFPNILTDFD